MRLDDYGATKTLEPNSNSIKNLLHLFAVEV
jgi:hypothetical protein